MKSKAQIIVALDVDTLRKAERIINLLSLRVKFFKVGSQLFTGCGPEALRLVKKKKARVFLDLKFFDIPNTVANAVRQAVRLKVDMLSLHISAGEAVVKAAVEAAKSEARCLGVSRPKLLGITILTSSEASGNEVLRLAKIGLDCGLDGVVASAQEAGLLRQKIGKDFLIVTPGIRPQGTSPSDQKRVTTVKEAVSLGADFLVVGRPIIEAKDPLKVTEEILLQLN